MSFKSPLSHTNRFSVFSTALTEKKPRMYYFFHNSPTENLVLFQTFISQVQKQQGPESANAGRKGLGPEDPWFYQVLLSINSAMKPNLCKVGSHRCSGLVAMSVPCGNFDLSFMPTLSAPPWSRSDRQHTLKSKSGQAFFCSPLKSKQDVPKFKRNKCLNFNFAGKKPPKPGQSG